MRFIDKAPVSGTRVTADGYLVATVKTARTGIQQYHSSELGLMGDRVINVYRSPDEVFKDTSMASYAHKPVTNDHPPVSVSAENWKDYAIGHIGSTVKRDGDYIVIDLSLMDSKSIKDAENGKLELSSGYNCNLVKKDGVAPCGTPYEYEQTDISINHVAQVTAGRAGSQARIGDSKPWGATPTIQDSNKEPSMSEKLKSVVFDGLTIEVTDQGAQVIDKLQARLADASEKLTAAEKKAKEDEEENEKKLAKKDAEIDALKGKVLDGAALDAAVQARGDLISQAKAIAPDVETKGLSDAAIRKAVVTAKLGDAVKGKSEAYIDVRFDILAEDAAGTDQLRDAISNVKPNVNDAKVADDALAKSNNDFNAWREEK